MNSRRSKLTKYIYRYRQPIVIAIHILLIPLSNYLAFWLRFDGAIGPRFGELMVRMFPWLILIRCAILYGYRLFQGLWRYTSIWDLWNIVASTFISSLLFYILVRIVLGIEAYPRSVYVVDSIILIFFLGGIRLSWRMRRELNRSFLVKKGKRVLIYGAGDAGEMIVRDMKHHSDYRYEPVGFVDDDASKVGQRIHGVRVFGTRSSLPEIIVKQSIDEIILAIPSADPSVMREVLKTLQQFNIPIKTLPNLSDILDGTVTVSQIRNLSVVDLLSRVPVNLDLSVVGEMLHDRRVLVTGAGGSIGAELCRQIAKLGPQELVLFERYENGLFDITNELLAKGYGNGIQPVIGDITDEARVTHIFQKHSPEVVFHAAAHKHVPLMEYNPCEAVKNNIIGTQIVARAAIKSGVNKFVFISTDKAVNPTSIMGASKNVGENLIQAISEDGMTSFVAVRFGNVLASNGSVVPLFLEQIKRGGPVTVTHPEMRRYFMLIPEAVQLVLLAAGMSDDGETYVLEMGEQLNVAEMARNIIRLSGFVPDVDIPIIYTGLRPGEKLFEELVADDEVAEPSAFPEILRIRKMNPLDTVELMQKIRQLQEFSLDGNETAVVESLTHMIPTFKAPVSLKEHSPGIS
jgi:FlaA1/EpsC-like NDP-sugar epimerase